VAPSTGRPTGVRPGAIGGHDPGMTIDAQLGRVAAGQHQMFTTRQATEAGVSGVVLSRLVTAGMLRHPCRGLYAVVGQQLDESAAGWHLHLCAGAALLYPDASLTGVSAALTHGISVWGVSLARPELHRPVDRAVGVRAYRVRPRPGGSARPDPVGTPWGPADPPATAVVQLTLDHGMLPGLVSADHAVHSGRATAEAIVEAARLVQTWPRSSRVRAMLAQLDGRSESVGETRTRAELAMHGIRTDPQVEVHDRRGKFVARVDFLVRGTNVVVEFDGRVKFDSGDPAVLWAEKRREDRLRALGYVVVRITWADLETPGRAVAKVRRALAAAA
jgi:very-short-patch-repair endonuclease